MNYVVDSVEFENHWTTMLFTISVNSCCSSMVWKSSPYVPVVALSPIPALYVVLFIFSIYTLHRRSPAPPRVLPITAWIMFVLTTCGTLIVISMTGISMRMNYLLVQGSEGGSARLLTLYHALALAQDVILAINNYIVAISSGDHGGQS
ncbi:hypothetical protein DFH07DRAFT_766659 [Mycena maculata]|uniref:Uncharacterized protein n=1 Tax=Mycena maculata TaxID=230809 RepID=A0AAD7NVS0_9AGAR|nr:hypothetical protein DFH07DRAFT_766659 [Mycena maculata]